MSPLLHEVLIMAKMTKAQARKRLKEAKAKVMAVYVQGQIGSLGVSTQDMVAIEKVLDKCIKRLI
tara:strand:+ start:969 stop:1163 length:195 start_codon:yes stop_codon:yes gene_type:complete